MSRRRTRSRSNRVLPLVAVLAVLALIGASVLPAASFSTATVDRDSDIGVVEDPDGVLGLNVTDSVTVGNTERLMVVTNRIETTVTVTVTLDDGSTSKGNLSIGGTDGGNEVSFDLSHGATQSIDVDVDDDDALEGEEIAFHVTADGSGVAVKSPDRRTTIAA